MASPLVIFLSSDSWEARYQATTLALTAAAMGDPVHLALFFGALRAWVEGRFDEGAPPHAAAARVPSLRQSLEEGRQHLSLRVVACDTAVRLAALAPEAIARQLDGIAALPDLWRLAGQGRALAL
jgi:peroxiredoxin family protein